MKNRLIIAAIAICVGAFGFAQVSLAQSCDNVSNPAQGTLTAANTTTPSNPLTGNNCNNNTNFSKICANSETLGGGGMDIIKVVLGATNNVTFSLNSSAFTPELGVISTTCSSSTTCLIDETIAAPGTVTGSLPVNSPAGTYYIFVANVTDAACGAYGLSYAGTLPVKLQKFSVN